MNVTSVTIGRDLKELCRLLMLPKEILRDQFHELVDVNISIMVGYTFFKVDAVDDLLTHEGMKHDESIINFIKRRYTNSDRIVELLMGKKNNKAI